MKKTYFVFTLSNRVVLQIKAQNVFSFSRENIRVVYCKNTLDKKATERLSQKAELTYCSYNGIPTEYFETDRRIYDAVEDYFADEKIRKRCASILCGLDADWERLLTSLKISMINSINDDATIIHLAARLFPDRRRYVFLVREYHFFKKIGQKNIQKIFFEEGFVKEIQFVHKMFRRMLSKIFGNKKKISQASAVADCQSIPVNNDLAQHRGVTFVFDQMYALRFKFNMEFEAFYSYFKTRDDVLYICTGRDSEIYRSLLEEGKKAVVKTDINVMREFKSDPKYFFVLMKVFFLSWAQGKSVQRAMLHIIYDSLYYKSLFGQVRPRFYMHVRGNFLSSHPVASAYADFYDVRTIGYMCGSHSINNPRVGHLDFNYYGILGWHYIRDLFRNWWPAEDKMKYFVLGPVLSELNIEEGEKVKENGLTIALFPTSTSDQLFMNDSYFESYIENSFRVIASLNRKDIAVYIKEKKNDDELFEKRLNLVNRISEKYDIPYEMVCTGREGKLRYITPETMMEAADVILVMGFSTIGWEALAKQKKFLVFEQEEYDHPFKKYMPKITVRDFDQYQASLAWLLNVSNDDYEKSIEHLLSECSKKSDGNMVRDFLEGIEATERRIEKKADSAGYKFKRVSRKIPGKTEEGRK